MYQKLLILFVFFVSCVCAERFMHIKIETPSNGTVFKVENAAASWGRICQNRSYDEVSAAELNEMDIDFLHPLTITPRSRPWTPFGIEGNFNIAAKMDNSTKLVSQVHYDYGFWHSDGTLQVFPENQASDYSCSHVGGFVIQCDKMVPKNETL